MSLVDWNKNIFFLKGIIDEHIEEERLTIHKDLILYHIEKIINEYYDKRFDYRNAIELNKDILRDVISIIQRFKKQKINPKPKPMIEEVYSRDDILKQRNNDFKKNFELKRREFESIHDKKVEEIDFRDKTNLPEENIDELMEKITQERNSDLEVAKNLKVDEKAVKEWISKGGDIDMDFTLLKKDEIKSTNDITQPLQKKVKSNIIDKMTEELLQERNYDTYQTNDSILKNKDNKKKSTKKNVSFEEKESVSPSLDMFKNKIKPITQEKEEINLQRLLSYLQNIDTKIDLQFEELHTRLKRIEDKNKLDS